MIVLANGVFDLLHVGHIEHLREARTFGEILIVCVTLDAFVNKGPDRPVNNFADRCALLRELRCVDAVIGARGLADAIERVRPAGRRSPYRLSR